MEPMARQKVSFPNLRKYPRGIYLAGAKLKIDGPAVNCATKNLTPEGVFVKTREALAVGDKITLIFSLPRSTKHLHINGKVVRHHQDGVGIKFDAALRDLLAPPS